jgi:hypothetical protein
MTTEQLKENLLKTAFDIIGVAREKCNNYFSDNIEFVIRRFDVSELDFFELYKMRRETYEKSKKLSVDKVVQELFYELRELSWIDLQIYKSEKNRTIIEIQLVKRQLNESLGDMELTPSFHASIPTPQYSIDSNDKFDINWQQDTLNHRLKYFLWKIKTKNKIKRLNAKNNVC